MVSKKFNRSESAQKIYASSGEWSPFGFGDFSTFKNGQISLSDHTPILVDVDSLVSEICIGRYA